MNPPDARTEQFDHAHLTEISASGNSLRIELRELWAYRDLLGRVHCALAAMCDEVILSVCGIPLKIK